MKNTIIKLMFVSALMFSVSTHSSAAQAQDIAIVNIQSIMEKSTAAQSARKQLKDKQKKFQQDLSKREKELQAKDQELAKQRSLLSKEEFKKQVLAFRKKAADVQKEVQTKRASLNKAFNSTLASIQKTVTNVVAEIAKEKGFKVAIPASHTLYFDGGLDISAEVLARLNKKLPSLSVKF